MRVIHSAAASKLRMSHDAAEKKGWLIADADHALTAQAFAKVRSAKAAEPR